MNLKCELFCKKIHFKCVTGSEFASDYNISKFFKNNKRAISRLFGTVTLATQPGVYLFNVNNRSTKSTRARCEICLKLTLRTLERCKWQ